MAQSIVQGLFGPAPWEVQQQQQAQQQSQAERFAQMDATQRGVMGMNRAGQQMGGLLAEGMGMVNPAVQAAQQREAAMQGIDWANPESIMQRANQVTDPRVKMQLTQLAQQMMAEKQKLTLDAQKGALAERRQSFMENESLEMKKQQLAQAFEIAKMRSEDTRLGMQQRAEAAKEANQIKLMMAQMMQEARMAAIDQRRDAAANKGSVAAEKVVSAKAGLSSTLDDLQAAYDALNQDKGLPSTQRGGLSNIGSYTASSGIGQAAGRMFGTKEQSQRDLINSSRMLLLNDIKNATGMSAQQMNSNVELQNWLKALGDPTVGYETATTIIDNIRKKYVDGSQNASGSPTAPPVSSTPSGGKRIKFDAQGNMVTQ